MDVVGPYLGNLHILKVQESSWWLIQDDLALFHVLEWPVLFAHDNSDCAHDSGDSRDNPCAKVEGLF